MRKNYLCMLLLLLLTIAGASNTWAETVNIPTAAESYISWNDCNLTGANVENSGANIGSTGKNTVATFTINNETKQDYILTFATGSKNAAKMQVTLTNTETTEVVLTKPVDVVSTGSWTPATINNFFLSQLPAGTYELKMQVTEANSYAGNWGKLAFYTTESFNSIPGTIGVASGGYAGGARLENNNTNVGWVSNGTSATYSFICSEAGVYKMTIPMTRYGDGTITTTVTNEDSGEVEASGTWTMTSPSNYEPTDVPVDGELTTGIKTLKMSFATTSSFLLNYKDFTFTRVGDHYSKVSGVTMSGQNVTTGDDSDWYCQLPAAYDATTTFSVATLYGTVTASAEGIDITDNGDGTFTMPTPEPGTTSTVNLTLTPAEGTFSNKTAYTLKLFRIGEMSLTAVTVNGIAADVLTDINAAPYTATYGGCLTSVPVIKVTQVDGAEATVGTPTVSGTTYTYPIHAAISGTDIARDYSLVLDNVHIYAATGDEASVNIKNNEGTRENGIWTNGIYTLTTSSLDGYNEFFKMNGNDYTITLPSDAVVKQLIFKDAINNYGGNDARLLSVTSEGVTAYIPTDNKFYAESEGSKHDIIVNIDGHTAGNAISFNLPKQGQPMTWIQLTIVKGNPGTEPQKTAEEVNVVNNHAMVTLTFDREIQGDINATINNSTVTAEGGNAIITFPIWGLDYATEYTLVIPAGAITDSYGNSNSEAINIPVNTATKPSVGKAVYDYVVSNATELDAALTELKESNKTADAARKTIFLRNGNYTYGTLEGSYQYNVSLKIDNWNNVYNVSLIGESKDGVLIEGTTDGITSSTLNLGNGTGIYVQDMTIRNNYDFPKADKGVSVAVTGGNKAVLKNVVMQACQDTYVTGQRTYLEDCDIYGTVDFICGGGDIFFNHCNLVLLYRQEDKRDVIVAPNTTASTKWGYVLQGCTIKAMEGENTLANKNYTLGRDWQNEPRANYLNTVMELQPSDEGWENMGGAKPTHFYEYGSTDKEGNVLDLSARQAPSHSTNLPYSPVLTAEQAAKFTVENVLGGTDSWLPTEQTVMTKAPIVASEGSTLSWADVEDARCYVIFKDGEYLTNMTALTLTEAEPGTYTVRAANAMGGLGKTSNTVTIPSASSGIDDIAAPTSTKTTYNLQGQRVATTQKGRIYIKGGKKIIR